MNQNTLAQILNYNPPKDIKEYDELLSMRVLKKDAYNDYLKKKNKAKEFHRDVKVVCKLKSFNDTETYAMQEYSDMLLFGIIPYRKKMSFNDKI